MKKIFKRIRESTVLPFIKIESKILVLNYILITKVKQTMRFSLRDKGEKQNEKEINNEVDFRRKAKDFPITSFSSMLIYIGVRKGKIIFTHRTVFLTN